MLLDWNPHKNSALKAERDISFDDIAGFIRQGIPYTVDSNTSSNHPDQKVIRMFIDEYAYYIPCVEITGGYFLKTIYPSRKATKKLK